MFTELTETTEASCFPEKNRQNSISSKGKDVVSQSPWFRVQFRPLWALLCVNFFIYKMEVILHKQSCEVKLNQYFSQGWSSKSPGKLIRNTIFQALFHTFSGWSRNLYFLNKFQRWLLYTYNNLEIMTNKIYIFYVFIYSYIIYVFIYIFNLPVP